MRTITGDVELEMLREFYAAWTGLQDAIKSHKPRFVLERKAQCLTEAHQSLQAFNAPPKPKLVIANG